MSEIDDIIRSSDEKADWLNEVSSMLETSGKAIAVFIKDDPDEESHISIRIFGTGRSYEIVGILEMAKLIMYSDNVKEDESE